MLNFYDADCTRCALSRAPKLEGKRVCVPGRGAVPARIMLFGEAPGANEEEQGLPFVGQAGMLLESCLAQANISSDDVFIDNTVRCRPPLNRTPTPAEQAACLAYTIRAIAAVQPEVIVAVGGAALAALTGRTKISAERGKVLQLKPEYRSAVPVIVTYHPAAALHAPHRRAMVLGQIVEDLRFAQRFLGGGTAGQVVTGYDFTAEVRDALATLRSECARVAVDVETNVEGGRKWPWSRRGGVLPDLTSVGIAGRLNTGTVLGVSVAIPRTPDESSLRVKTLKELIASVPSIYHNATYDLIWLLAYGYAPQLAGDTMVLASLLNIESSHSLESLTSLLTDVAPGWKKESAVLSVVGRRPDTREGWQTLLEYNAKDCISTVLLEEAELRKIREEGRERAFEFYNAVLLPSTYALARASLFGAPIDMQMLRRAEYKARVSMMKLAKKIGQMLGVEERFEVVFNDNVLGPLLEQHGITLPRTPKTHRPSVRLDDLIPREKEHAVMPPLILLRRIEKLENAYLRPWLHMLEEQGDARLHTIFKPTGATTGRTSAESESGGTLQQYPHEAYARAMVCAEPGFQILAADYSQIELRIAAWLANERTLIHFLNAGIDPHTATAGWIKAGRTGETIAQYRTRLEAWIPHKGQTSLGEWLSVTPDERYRAKPANFALLYGGTEHVLINVARADYGIDLTFDEASMMRAGWAELYPDFIAWHEAHWNIVERGWTETVFGRRRRIDFENEDAHGKLRKAINTPVQATASDLTQLALAQIDAECSRRGYYERGVVRPFGMVHDSILIEVADEVAEEVEELVSYEMTHPNTERLHVIIPVPLEAEVKRARRWA
jgi:uracil-DNA glycosylase family 4